MSKDEVYDSWDDLCVNPYQSSLEQGRAQGKEGGGLAGFHDGQALGRTKGIEYGMELGFVRGFLEVVSAQDQPNPKIVRSLRELSKALDDFPSPDDMFSDSVDTTEQPTNKDDDNDSEQPAGSSEKLDIMNKMQRVRARFKLVSVQLGMPHVSLKDIMDQAAAVNIKSDPPGDKEW
jgi:hypothetical protein